MADRLTEQRVRELSDLAAGWRVFAPDKDEAIVWGHVDDLAADLLDARREIQRLRSPSLAPPGFRRVNAETYVNEEGVILVSGVEFVQPEDGERWCSCGHADGGQPCIVVLTGPMKPA